MAVLRDVIIFKIPRDFAPRSSTQHAPYVTSPRTTTSVLANCSKMSEMTQAYLQSEGVSLSGIVHTDDTHQDWYSHKQTLWYL